VSAPQRRLLLVEEGGLGGVASYTAELARAVAGAGWDVHLATGCEHEPMTAPRVHVHPLFPYVRGRTRLGRLARGLRLSRPINGATHLAGGVIAARLARDCDIVHVQGEEWPPLGAIQATMLRAAGRPIVYTPHNTFDRGAHSYTHSHAIIRRCAATIVVHSEYDRSLLPAAPAAKTVVIPHGEYGNLARRGAADVDHLTARGELGASEEELVVLLFGQLRPDKGVRDLLQAAAEVAGTRVVLAGEDHGALAEVADLLRDKRLRGRVVTLPGYASPEQTGRLFAAADVVALPYQRASASGVLLLAYGYSRPVLAYPVGGLPEYVVDGSTGWLCERADPPSLAQGLRSVRARGRREWELRGEQARRFAAEHLAWDSIAKRTIECYEQLLRRTAGDGDPGPPGLRSS
jgi:glycosyltransferase involved in cell wall biosynthesis